MINHDYYIFVCFRLLFLFQITIYSFHFIDLWGESKRYVKNKARVEGSICAAYLHRKTTYFCSHYFNNFILLPSNVRNETHWQNETCDSTLSVFQEVVRHAGKELTY